MLSVRSVFDAASCRPLGVVRWGEAVGLDRPGVYVVASSAELDEAGPEAPWLSQSAVEALLASRPDLALDGTHPTAEQLGWRLWTMGIPGAAVFYIGAADRSVAKRVDEMYRTPVGADKPHPDGWPLKLLANLDEMYVWFAAANDPRATASAMLDAFVVGTRTASLDQHCDPFVPIPYGNSRGGGGQVKRHGISIASARAGSTEGKVIRGESATVELPSFQGMLAVAAPVAHEEPAVSHHPLHPAEDDQRVGLVAHGHAEALTAADLTSGVVRIVNAAHEVFHHTPLNVRVSLRGVDLGLVRWEPRLSTDGRLAGSLQIGRRALARVMRVGEALEVRVDNSVIVLE